MEENEAAGMAVKHEIVLSAVKRKAYASVIRT